MFNFKFFFYIVKNYQPKKFSFTVNLKKKKKMKILIVLCIFLILNYIYSQTNTDIYSLSDGTLSINLKNKTLCPAAPLKFFNFTEVVASYGIWLDNVRCACMKLATPELVKTCLADNYFFLDYPVYTLTNDICYSLFNYIKLINKVDLYCSDIITNLENILAPKLNDNFSLYLALIKIKNYYCNQFDINKDLYYTTTTPNTFCNSFC